MAPSYISWQDSRVEPPVENEQCQVDELLDTMHSILQKHFSTHRHASRATHVKTQAIVKGNLTIPSDLPPHLAQGLFRGANTGTHPVALRFANEPIFIQDDRVPGPRGVGMKIFNVEGSSSDFMEPEGASTHTHDMTFNNAPMLELRDVKTTKEIFAIRNKHYSDHEALEQELKKRPDADTQLAPATLPNQHFVSYVMYSQSAYRFGDYVAKFALFPSTKTQQELAEAAQITDSSGPEQHSTWLREYFLANDAEYELRAQLLVNPEKQPVEDTSVPWEEKDFPFETVGTVKIPKDQDAFDAKRRVFWDDEMKLNPWYGLREHQPLGSVNRLRREVYKLSAKTRSELNAREARAVGGVDDIP
ncbi:heme-dependent catalase [Saccharata proteae CBS 121410]|uniref:Heme-dependent catalase n=1 Tax=Saccharata proteae CBS 121410 TaxID=1314787 RepID=A0A9P4LWN0_9PEZI|nr:heme-dependent catalase [Saccharata proteae CBS 121410]